MTNERKIATYKRWIKEYEEEIADRKRLILAYKKEIKALEK